MFQRLVILVFCLAVAGVATADVTIRSTVSGQGLGQNGTGESVTYLQGMKMRIESSLGGKNLITLMDIDKKRMVLIDGKKADAFDMNPYLSQQVALSVDDVAVELKPTGQTRDVAGASCEEYQMRIKLALDPSAPPEMGKVNTVIHGPTCMVKGAPGLEEYARFYQIAWERGFFFGDPRAAKAQPGRERGMTALYKTMAEKGMPYWSQMKIDFEGDGFMAQMMAKMGLSITTTVKSVSTEALDAALFEVPAGVKVKEK
jgi:hypothetical protein